MITKDDILDTTALLQDTRETLPGEDAFDRHSAWFEANNLDPNDVRDWLTDVQLAALAQAGPVRGPYVAAATAFQIGWAMALRFAPGLSVPESPPD